MSLPEGLAGLHEHLLMLGKTEDRTFSFSFLGQEKNRWKYNYYWQAYISRVDFDEDGLLRTEEIINFSFCELEFYFSNSKMWLRVKNPPRSVKDLLDNIERAVGFGFFVESVSLFLNDNFLLLGKNAHKKLIAFKAFVPMPMESSLVRMEAVSKEGMDLDSFTLLQKNDYQLDQLTYEVMFERARGQISIGRSGLVKIGGQISPYLLEQIEKSLAR